MTVGEWWEVLVWAQNERKSVEPIEEFTTKELEDELVKRSKSIVIVRGPKHDEINAQLRLTHEGEIHEVMGLVEFARYQCQRNIIDYEEGDDE